MCEFGLCEEEVEVAAEAPAAEAGTGAPVVDCDEAIVSSQAAGQSDVREELHLATKHGD